MTVPLPAEEGVTFGATVKDKGGTVTLVDDDRTTITIPESMSVTRIDIAEDIQMADGAVGRALVTVAAVNKTAGSNDHKYVHLRVDRFEQESVEKTPKQSQVSATVGSRITMRGGERDVAGPRSTNYRSVPTNLTRQKL